MMHSVMWGALLMSIFAHLYHYLIYPATLWLLPNPLRDNKRTDPKEYSISVVVCAYNEAGIISAKIKNSLELDPAPSRILVLTDGSDDGTDDVARNTDSGDIPMEVLHDPARKGKASAMNRAAKHSSDDILCYTDANAMLSTNALSEIIREFGSPNVGVVSGSKRVIDAETSKSLGAYGDGLYWRWESFIRSQESKMGATVATVGELLAVRSDIWEDIPPSVVNDDSWIAMRALTRGYDVRYAQGAESWETATPDTKMEAERRRRINAGRIRLLTQKGVWPLRRPFVLLAFVSHKVLRLFLPFLFALSLFASVVLALSSGQLVSAEMAIALAHLFVISLAWLHRPLRAAGLNLKLSSAAFHILSSYVAVVLAVVDTFKGRDHVIWAKSAR